MVSDRKVLFFKKRLVISVGLPWLNKGYKTATADTCQVSTSAEMQSFKLNQVQLWTLAGQNAT